jgi:outer membrane protein OmpA-like peptidoglycan-associated protein
MSLQKILAPARRDDDRGAEHWMSVADLMAGLMMVFLFISIAFMHFVRVERDRIKEIAIAYQQAKVELYRALQAEFGEDLSRWNARLDKQTLEVQFLAPDVLFETGRADLKPAFEGLLTDFFPRYVRVLDRFRKHIEEVRIEGHTSSDWAGVVSEEAYFLNMELSQGRTRAVLDFVSRLPAPEDSSVWTRQHFAAVGYSSSRPVIDPGTREEDRGLSRRVSFRVITNAEVQIRKIIDPD